MNGGKRSFTSVLGVSLLLIIVASGFFLRGVSGANDNGQTTRTTTAAKNLLAAKLEQTYALADFNGDGLTDVAVTDFLSDSVSVMVGDRAGYFHSVTKLSSGGGPRAMVAADFNRDGAVDLAVANFFSGDVAVFAGRGDSSFEQRHRMKLGEGLASLVGEDFNSDGSFDLAVANFLSGEVMVLKGAADGSFAAPALVGQVPGVTLILSGDQGGDGLKDLVAFDVSSGEARLFAGDGGGSFREAGNIDPVIAVSLADAEESRAIRKLSGDGQSAPAGAALPQPLLVEVGGQGESSRGEKQIAFSMLYGDGKLEVSDTRTTDERGQASLTLSFGELPGNNLVAAATEGQVAVLGELSTLSYADFFEEIRASLAQTPPAQSRLRQQHAFLDETERLLSAGDAVRAIARLKERPGWLPDNFHKVTAGLLKRLVNQLLLLDQGSATSVTAPITCNVPVTNTITQAGQTHSYTLSGNAGESVNISAARKSGSSFLCIVVELIEDATGNLVGSTRNACNRGTGSLRLPSTGNYTILVRDDNFADTGAYVLSLSFATGQCGTAIACGETKSGTLEGGGHQASYIFSGNAGEAVNISAARKSGSSFLCTVAELYSPSGALIKTSNCNRSTGSVTLPSTGAYTILIRDDNFADDGLYVMSLSFVTGRCGASFPCNGTGTLTGNFTGGGQQDSYTFTGGSGEAVNISAARNSGASSFLCAVAELYDPAGRLIATGSCNSKTGSVTLPAAGAYTVVVRDDNFADAGDYAVSLGFVTGRCAAPIAGGDTKSGTIINNAQQDTFAFSGRAGGSVNISSARVSGSSFLCTVAELYNPSGALISTSACNGSTGIVPLTTTGSYTILVRDDNFADTGAYSVSLVCIGDSCGPPPPPPSCPAISGISPTSGSLGASVTITGTNLIGVTSVRFFSTNITANFTVHSNTLITATVPNGAASGPITISKPNCADVQTQSFTVTTQPACPIVNSLNPTSGQVGANVTITGANFTGVTGIRFFNNVTATNFSVNGGGTLIIANVPSGAMTGPITISKPHCPDAQTGVFEVTTNRVVRVKDTSGAPGSSVTVLVELVSQGDENALGFSLTFDPNVLTFQQAALGSDAAGATLNTNPTQVGLGRLGITLAFPAGQRFNAGAREILRLTFVIASNTSASATQICFGDQPIRREVSGVSANILPADYVCGTVTITAGIEADVAPRPNGDGRLSVIDWVQCGRFTAGIDTPAPGSEFQRADCAPRETRGDGRISTVDWVQCGRYVAGLDPMTPAGGPTAPVAGNLNTVLTRAEAKAAASGPRAVRVINANLERGQRGAVTIELDAQGDENAAGFSLNFDPAQLRFVSAVIGSGATGATLNVNSSQAESGRVGLVLALPSGQVIAAGLRPIVNVTFEALSGGSAASATISFGDQPIAREISGVNANLLPADYVPGVVTITGTGPGAGPSVNSISPSGPTVSSSEQSIVVNGSGFQSGLTVTATAPNGGQSTLSGAQIQNVTATSFVMRITLNAAGNWGLRVNNPDGRQSNTFGFTVITSGNPTPTLASLSPGSATTGGAAFTLTVTGANFINGSVVRWNGSDRLTTFISDRQMTAVIPASDIAAAGTASVTVFNPPPGGGLSNALPFNITPSTPSEAEQEPNETPAQANLLTIPGRRIGAAAVGDAHSIIILYDNGDRDGIEDLFYFDLTNSARVEVTLTAANKSADLDLFLLSVSGIRVTVINLSNGPGSDERLVSPPLAPGRYYVGVSAFRSSSAYTLTVALAGAPIEIIPPNPTTNDDTSIRISGEWPNTCTPQNPQVPPIVGNVIRINTSNPGVFCGQAFTSYRHTVSVGRLAAGIYQVIVTHTYPGGQEELGRASFTVTPAANPVPALTSLSPGSATAGGTGFTLTVIGRDFVNGAVVRWNGSDRATNWVNSAQLMATITAADIATAGTANVTVFNPSPGGGSSNPVSFAITAPPTPCIATVPPDRWRGEYFNNRDLSGAPAMVRDDGNGFINFNWGAGSPGGDCGISADNFSARLTRTVNFAAGVYRFTVTADDGVRMYVDDGLKVDKWINQSATTYTVDVDLAAGSHSIKLEYYENGGLALAQLSWELVSPSCAAVVSPGNWKGEYFNNKDLGGAPAMVRDDGAGSIDFDWDVGSPGAACGIGADNFSVRWTRGVSFGNAGNYRFTVTADDGVRLFVDNQLLLDKWINQSATTYSVDVFLAAGDHAIRLEYYENTGLATAKLSWNQAGYQLYGINFGPYVDGQDPNLGSQVSEEQLRARMRIVLPHTRWIRTFGCANGLEKAGRIAREFGLRTAIGAWLSRDPMANEREIANLIAVAQAGEADLLIVGSEVLLRRDLTERQLLDYINRVKQAAPGIPVTTADVYGKLLEHPEVIAAADVLMVNIYGYFEEIRVDAAMAALHHWYQRMVAAAGGKTVIVSETGWPSCGDTKGKAVPSPENASFYFLNFVSWARANNIPYFYFSAFDESWKARYEGPQGACWGIWDKDGNLKPGMRRVFDGETMPDNWTLPGGPGQPRVEFTDVPAYGSFDNLRGQVWHLKPEDHKVAVYIRVGSGWWTKPTFAQPLTIIEPSGRWVCDITTGGADHRADRIAVFVFRNGYNPILLSGDATLPPELDQNAVAKVEVERMP